MYIKVGDTTFKVKKVKDKVGEGKCAPTGYDLINEATTARKMYDEGISENDQSKLKFAKMAYKSVEDMIKQEEKEIDDFDAYWQKHKEDIKANIRQVEKILNK